MDKIELSDLLTSMITNKYKIGKYITVEGTLDVALNNWSFFEETTKQELSDFIYSILENYQSEYEEPEILKALEIAERTIESLEEDVSNLKNSLESSDEIINSLRSEIINSETDW